MFASLVVLLGYTNTFRRARQWKDSAEYELDGSQHCGFRQVSHDSGNIDIVVYHSEHTSESARGLFQGLVEEILKRKRVLIKRYPSIWCSACNYLQERSTVVRRMTEDKKFIACEDCGERNALPEVAVLELPGAFVSAVNEQHNVASGRSAYQAALVRVKSLVRDRGIAAPSCFISYAWGVAADERWVERLARDLLDADVLVTLDVWDNAAAGQSIGRFISRMENADYILPACTPAFKSKYENTVAEEGSIVAAEVDIMYQRMTGSEAMKASIVPILRAGNDSTSLPPLLKGRVRYDMRDDLVYFERLLDVILTLYKFNFGDPVIRGLRELLGTSPA